MNKEYRMLSFVERWSIAPRHHHQSVAEHSFFVALYSSQLCDMLNISAEDRFIVLDCALRHDAREVWSSDIPGPAKRSLIDLQRAAIYYQHFDKGMDLLYRQSMRHRNRCVLSIVNGEVLGSYAVVDIIKVADLIDEVFFLAIETQLGNQMVVGLYDKEWERLKQAAELLAGDEFTDILLVIVSNELDRLWTEGAVIPHNDTDLDR